MNKTTIAAGATGLGLTVSLLTAAPAYAAVPDADITNHYLSAYTISVYDRSDCTDARLLLGKGDTGVDVKAFIVHAYVYVKDNGGLWKGPYWGGYCRINPGVSYRLVRVYSNARIADPNLAGSP